MAIRRLFALLGFIFYISLTLITNQVMNKAILLILLTIPFFGYMQDSTQVESPKIVARLKIGSTIDFEDKQIKFVRVIEDSRCPKGVDCMWPGEIKISIGVYENGALTQEKELIFGAQAVHSDQMQNIIKTNKKAIYGYNVSPYPSSEKPIDPKTYFLELLIK